MQRVAKEFESRNGDEKVTVSFGSRVLIRSKCKTYCKTDISICIVYAKEYIID